MMRDIYSTHSSVREEVSIIISVNADIIYSYLLEHQPSRTITFGLECSIKIYHTLVSQIQQCDTL